MSVIKNLKYRKSDVDVDQIETLINAGYEAQRRKPGFKKKTSFAPSSIGYGHGNCARYWFYAFEGGIVIDENEAESIATMANGSAAHERIQKAMENAGMLVEAEKEITISDPPIRGFLDAIVKVNDEEMVGEIKTTRSESFIFRQNSMKPVPYHLYQLLIYLRATGLNKGFILYENRNDQTMLIIPVVFSERYQAALDDCFEWLREVRKAWEDKELPKRPKGWTIKNKFCRGCPMYNICWSDNTVATKEIPLMEVISP